MRRLTATSFQGTLLMLLGVIGIGLPPDALPQYEGVPGCYISHFAPDLYDDMEHPVWDCPNGAGRAVKPEFTGVWYAAIAKSGSSLTWGASWHHASERAASDAALKQCRQNGANDCKVAITGSNNCLSLAESVPDGAWAAEFSNLDRSGAISSVMTSCRKFGGRNCRVVVTPCGRNNPLTPPCIPTHPIDISRGEVWKRMSPQERAMWNRPANGACQADK